jgi:threonine dehydrogenase-like Zn-dependent dehydrogenase
MSNVPETQRAVQLVGADELVFNDSKEVFKPGPHQILCQVEATGLCFSDLKLLKQFSGHLRKGPVISGVEPGVLDQFAAYVPEDKPTVPGHETVIRIAEVGAGVEDFKPGERYLVQTDYRWLKTENSNGAFGYNIEGGLQEYVLMDDRIITSPEGESMLIPVSEKLSASAAALVEPWACVEDAYVSAERQKLNEQGQTLVVADTQIADGSLDKLYEKYGQAGQVTLADSVDGLSDIAYDDVIYFGCNAETVEALFTKVANGGLFNVVLCGGKLGRDIEMPVGRIHYGGIRVIGTVGDDPCESMEYVPACDEIRQGDSVNIVGAGGPMGVMHVIRSICQGVKDVTVFAGDLDDDRLASLTKVAAPLAEKNGLKYRAYNPKNEKVDVKFDYTSLMAPIPALVAASVGTAAKRGLINIFAGIPATVTGQIDLDSYIEKQLYFIGTSGSTLDDMKKVLAKVESGQLDTNVSAAAVSGLENAVDGIRAVEKQLIAGKIIVYPACKGLGLVKLEDMSEQLNEVAECLDDGLWTKEAEDKLLKLHEGC